MLKFSEIFEFSKENSYFERIRMVRMVRSLADRTFQLCSAPPAGARERNGGAPSLGDSEVRLLLLGLGDRPPPVQKLLSEKIGWSAEVDNVVSR